MRNEASSGVEPEGEVPARREISEGFRDHCRDRVEETKAKLRIALEEMRKTGGPFNPTVLAEKAGVSRPTVYDRKHREFLDEVRRLNGRNADEKREAESTGRPAKTGGELGKLRMLLRESQKMKDALARENKRLWRVTEELRKKLAGDTCVRGGKTSDIGEPVRNAVNQ